ncbi:MAG: hypothetical protein GXO39_05630 [Thermotogae bacterium]|nr:hypothetical protein [Thermotogota bacterium]
MFALEFLNFPLSGVEFASKGTPFLNSTYSEVRPTEGVGVALAGGMVPGDLYGGVAVAYNPFVLSLKGYRSGDILVTTLPDTTSPPSEDNPPRVVDRINFGAYEGRVSAVKVFSSRFRGGISLKFIYASAGKYGWGAGGGLNAFLLYVPFNRLEVFLNVENLTSSPVLWSTGRRELAYPIVDLRLRLRTFNRSYVLFGGSYSPDGRGFNLWRDAFLTFYSSFWRLAVFGGLVEGSGRAGVSYNHSLVTFTLATSYHLDFGYSLRGDVSLAIF